MDEYLIHSHNRKKLKNLKKVRKKLKKSEGNSDNKVTNKIKSIISEQKP